MENKIVIENGKKSQEYEILATCISKNDKEYIVYTDNKKDKDGFVGTYAGILNGKSILPLSNDEDVDIIQNLLNKLKEGEKNEK